MKFKNVLYDLDGTLLPMDQDLFIKTYFKLLCKKLAQKGRNPEKVVEAVWAGTNAMMKNDGKKLNRDMFWDTYETFFGEGSREDRADTDTFYSNEFNQVSEIVHKNPIVTEVIEKVRAAGLRQALATQPVFPEVATRARVSWTGLDFSDFEYVSTYDNSYFGKPNPEYFKNFLEKLDMKPEETLMVGNDAVEDVAATKVGITVFLITDFLENKKNVDISDIPHGSFEDLLRYLSLD